ncbi:MAG TPA: endolytic transglycosylase MltG [Solirubrobacteraceae bacterium]|nr:endolytic transglycosylase MltG [Solirubrobacteraceae bacterium]
MPERTQEERDRERAERERRRAERAASQGSRDAPVTPVSPSPIEEPPPIAEEPPPVAAEPPQHLDPAPPQPDPAPPPLDPEAPDPASESPDPASEALAGGAELLVPEPAPSVEPPPVVEEPPPAPEAQAPEAEADPAPEAVGEHIAPEAHGPAAESDPAQEAVGEHIAREAQGPAAESEPAQEAAGGHIAPEPQGEGAEGMPARQAPTGEFLLPPAPLPAQVVSARRAGATRRLKPSVRGRRARRSLPSRSLAVLALAAVVVAVVLLVKSLAGSGGSERKAPAATVVRVVVPEGATGLQIAHIAAKDGLKGSYRAASKRSSLLNPTHYGAPAGTHGLEGFLFPATYDMLPGAPASRLVHEQLVAFGENFGSTEIARARSLHVTPYQLLTVASMIEREAKVPGDRAKISAVIYNRLKKGMPLGIDATIYYALEMQKNIPTYTQELTAAQLQLNSAYNTRTRTGLPPTPIANPGVASIEAAAKPAHVSYLYYVLAPDGCGEHAFSTTLAKFEADAAAYQAAVKKNGGAPPACKK